MKKMISLTLLLGLMGCMLALPSCDGNTDVPDTTSAPESQGDVSAEPSSVAEPVISEESTEPVPDPDAAETWKAEYADSAAGLDETDDIYGVNYYYNGVLTDDYTADPSKGDAKFIFNGTASSRFVNIADGYMITFPSSATTGDFSLSEYRSSITAGESIISISKEDKSPYQDNEDGWNIYLTEWLNIRINDVNFLSDNNIMRTAKAETHTDFIPGYEVIEYDMFIKLPKDIERPYYNIAIIKRIGEYKEFYLVVMKSPEKVNDEFHGIISSMKFMTPVGKSEIHVGQYDLIKPDYWSDETKAYFDKLCANNVPDWGFFYEGNDNDYIDWMASEQGIDYTPEVFMTYLHIGWYSTKNFLDLDYVNRNAGGDGFNGKPVLNLTYQFTTTNNNISGYSPMFDIIRGKLDDHFRRLAQDIKSYGKPVVFRLNNEMNTDWTSYCGVVTLLDPDIYVMTWRRLYDIFREEGVDNTIWVFNPITVTCPYCDWGEFLTYFPGPEYCQMLGLTYYEPGNGQMESFQSIYKKTYDMYSPHFDNYPWMIGEFACGAGGEKQYDWGTLSYKDTILARSEANQASWVEAMFRCFMNSTKPGYEFANKIKLAVWFSCNDYADPDGSGTYYVVNYYKIDERLDKTIEKFREWLPKMHE